MCRLVIGYEHASHIVIDISNRRCPNGDNDNDEDMQWLNAAISIKSGAFTGSVDASLRIVEFEYFYKDMIKLHESLKGTAKFHSCEEWLDIEIQGDGRGHFIAQGSVGDDPGSPNRLNFIINFDQTIMPKIMSSLKQIIRK